jgi:hypothetical protein
MPREIECELPIGYVDEDGRLYHDAALRKMTGREEALLADRKLRRNAGRLVTELLGNCLTRIGTLSPVPPHVVSRLTSVDRNYLLVELRKFTFGPELEGSYACPSCGETNFVLENLDELPVRRLNGSGAPEIIVELEDGFEDRGELYSMMVFRLPNGLDEEKTASQIKENASRGMNAMLARCLVQLGDMADDRREMLGTKIMTDLTLSDRTRIERAFRQEIPGVNLRRDLQCDFCGHRFDMTLDMSSFFSPQ